MRIFFEEKTFEVGSINYLPRSPPSGFADKAASVSESERQVSHRLKIINYGVTFYINLAALGIAFKQT